MKKVIALLGLVIFLAGCKKNNLIGPEPGSWYTTKIDTLNSGEYWGIQIGEDRETVYNKLRTIRNEKKISSLYVSTPSLNSLTSIKDKLSFYNGITLTASLLPKSITIRIIFADEVVSAIYSNMNTNGQLTNWPANMDNTVAIRPGDSIPTLYNKLVALNNNPLYAAYFNGIGLSEKNLAKDYENGMSTSNPWYAESRPEEKKITLLNLIFNNTELDTIIVQQLESH